MGVTGLWTILHPCARPIKLETLNRKRLAVDASIWIYQFLKAVRDKEGNALRNSHVVGFFRRICKLLFFGIKPVFVFDGGAPVLKRQTVSERKKRREGRREDAVRTAGRLLAVQMQRRAEEDEARRKEEQRGRGTQDEVIPDEGLVYVDEIHMTQQERQQNRKFRKKDAYHLPDLDVSMNEMGGSNDPRVMSLEELQAYAKQFETGEDINVYDFSKIDFDSLFFMSLPASDRYNILNAARLRSRLRMGHSKEQLDTMFPDRMAFSKFQIERVRERNELTQRLMHLNEGGDTLFGDGGRVAGEKGREYVLVKNDGVEGGWALGVISDEGTKQETAIDLDKPAAPPPANEEEWEDEDDFEDVPIEGLNRLPKPRSEKQHADPYAEKRAKFYAARKSGSRRAQQSTADEDSLFVGTEKTTDDTEEWEEVGDDPTLFGEVEGRPAGEDESEDEDLRRAIALSLEAPNSSAQEGDVQETDRADSDDEMLEVFEQSAVAEARPLPKGSGRAIANAVNKRAFDVAPESREIASFGVYGPKPDEASGEDDGDTMDFHAALAESRRTKRKISSPSRQRVTLQTKPQSTGKDVAKRADFTGPLPFEKLDLGTSLLGKKKMQERSEEAAGGFEKPELEKKEQKAEPLPPWFSGDLEDDIRRQKAIEDDDRQKTKNFNNRFQFQSRGETLRRNKTNEIIDLDAESDHSADREVEMVDLEVEHDVQTAVSNGTILHDPEIRMGDVADKVRIEPPVGDQPNNHEPLASKTNARRPFDPDSDSSSDDEPDEEHARPITELTETQMPSKEALEMLPDSTREDEELIDWSESDVEEEVVQPLATSSSAVLEEHVERQSRSPSADFEDVEIPAKPSFPPSRTSPSADESRALDQAPPPASGLAQQEIDLVDDLEQAEFDDFSDPEDGELLHALAQEAEEHARFASTLNNKTQAQNIADYEKELKQLRNQQKKDRRDADEITQVMIQECQELLRHFGLPYVTAPMEAEAQCAELVRLGLVDGIVTDDSDCFLFGGTRIYKNMFNQAKFVECYLTTDLEKEFDLTRDKLIQVAHLLGSDYTEGLPGVGPVTALEILGEFQTLNDFKTWWSGVQMNTITKSEDAGKPFRKKFRRNATKLFLPPTFPDDRVDIAYLNPQVDSDPEPFQWGLPDLIALRQFLMTTIGWGEERTDEVLVPVIRDMNRRADEGTQSNITAFFDGGVGIGAAGAGGNKASAITGDSFAPRKRVQESSKRMGSALSKMADRAKTRRGRSNKTSDEYAETDDAEQMVSEFSAESKGRGTGTKRTATSESASPDDTSDVDYPRKKSRANKLAGTRRKRTQTAE